MKTITAITPQVKNANRCNIYLDGEFFCGMSLEAVMKNRLKAGVCVSEKQLEEIQLENEKNVALDKAMTFLSGSVKTEKQVYDYLKEKGFTALVRQYVLEKIKDYGFVNDSDYARRYVETYSNRKGVKLIQLELKRKGVSEECAEQAVSALGSQADTAKMLAEKYMKNKEVDRKTIQKLYRHLLSKGFTYDDAKEAVERYLSEDEQ